MSVMLTIFYTSVNILDFLTFFPAECIRTMYKIYNLLI